MNERDNIVAICKGCNRLVFVCVNAPHILTQDRFKEIGEMTRHCRIEHWTTEAVRKSDFKCNCNPTYA